MYLCRDYFKANVYAIWVHGPLGFVGSLFPIYSIFESRKRTYKEVGKGSLR